MFRFRYQLDQRLIREVNSRPILWNKTLIDYRRRNIRDSEWNKVAQTLQVSIRECKRRWRTLRDSFVKYHRSKIDGEINGIETSSRKKEWNFYEDMLFLLPYIDSRENSEMAENFEQTEEDLNESKPEKVENMDPTPEISIDIEDAAVNDPLDCDEFSKDAHFAMYDNTIRNLDPDEYFLLSYAAVLKRLPPQKNALARLKIQQILYDIEFGKDSNE